MHLVGNRCRVDLQRVGGDTVTAWCAAIIYYLCIYVYIFFVFSGGQRVGDVSAVFVGARERAANRSCCKQCSGRAFLSPAAVVVVVVCVLVLVVALVAQLHTALWSVCPLIFPGGRGGR